MATQLIIPLFPLPLTVFPGEELPLHIFEERYKLMIGLCLDRGPNALIGVTFVDSGTMADIGCAVSIERILERYPDGRLDITTRGRARFIMRELIERHAYAEARVELFEDPPEADSSSDMDRSAQSRHELRERVVALHTRFTELTSGKPVMHDYRLTDLLSFTLAVDAGLPHTLRQKLLEMLSEKSRLEFLADYFQKANEDISKRREIRQTVGTNGFLKH